MTVPFIQPLITSLGRLFAYPYPINNSAKYEADNSQYLVRSGQAGNVSIGSVNRGTFSTWFKRTIFDIDTMFLSAYTDASNNTFISINSSNKIVIHHEDGGSADNIIYPMLIRDPSHFHNVVIVIDSAQATGADRVKLWFNGVFQTAESGTLDLNDSLEFNEDSDIYIGDTPEAGTFFWDGYMAETVLLAGQALDETYFGEFKNNTWVPKNLSSLPFQESHDFYLRYQDNSNLGDDSSGQGGGDFTNTNGVSQTEDTPTNNYPIWNLFDTDNTGLPGIFSKAGLQLTTRGTGEQLTRTTAAIPSTGKWQGEFKTLIDPNSWAGGIKSLDTPIDTGEWIGNAEDEVAYYATIGNIWTNNTQVQSGLSTITAGNTLGVVVDSDADTVTFYRNGVQVGTPVNLPTIESNNRFCFAASSDTNIAVDDLFFNSGAEGFDYPITGAKAISTANFPSTEISIIDSEKGLWIPTWVGDSSASRDITGSSFNCQSDCMVWFKDRTSNGSHGVTDTLRGAQNYLLTNATDVNVNDTNDGVLDFLTNGITIGRNSLNFINTTGRDYIAWVFNMLAKYGMGIVEYLGTGSNRTVNHNLGGEPELYAVKNRDSGGSSDDWFIYCKYTIDANPEAYFVRLNETAVRSNSTTVWNNTAPTSSVFHLGVSSSNINNDNFIAYLFRSIPGFLKVGYYIGNGLVDGPRVYTGFRPRYFVVKNVITTSNWVQYDSVRLPYNLMDGTLRPNTSDAETGGNNEIDFLSNGIKLRNPDTNSNRNGDRHIYIAIADMPYPYVNAF